MKKNRQLAMRGFVYGEEQVGTEQSLPISDIVLPDYQPRLFFDEKKLDEMAQSIKSQGIFTRLIVRRVAGTNKYELVAGGRRYRAAQRVGLTEVPVVVKKLTDDQALALAMTENLQREDLNPLEQTESLLRLIALRTGKPQEAIPPLLTRMYNDSKRKAASEQNVLFTQTGKTIQALFNELGGLTWESFVTSRLPLLNLPSELLTALREGKISYTKVQALAKVKEPDRRQDLLVEAIEQSLSLTAIKEKVKALANPNGSPSPKETIQSVTKKITEAKIWENAKKWKKVQALLQKLEDLIELE